jgi:hypothetical protein
MAVTAADVLNAAQQLSLPELETVLARLTALRAQRAVEAGALAEPDLIRLIREAVPPAVQRRYDQLKARRRSGTLTEAEHQEFLRLIDLVEQLDAQRLEHLLQLARLRGTPLTEVMADLGLATPAAG